jgi:hypothetical protein
MKKLHFLTFLFPLLLTSCGTQVNQRVTIPFSDSTRTVNNQLIDVGYNELSVMVTNKETFILVVGNETCGCTLDLLPVMRQWIGQHRVPVYYVEYLQLLFQNEKFGIPLVSGALPVLTIFNEGSLGFFRAYNTRNNQENALFYSLPLLSDWLSERLVLPAFHFLNKTQFDHLFASTGQRLMLYIGREDCPDCSYAFQSFLIDYLNEQTSLGLPPIYGIDVMRNGIRLPVDPNRPEVTGNQTPGWDAFKANYGLDPTLNTTFGYNTGHVPTFLIVETNGKLIQEDPTIIMDMLVVYNDSTRDEFGNWTPFITRSFFDGTRPLQYVDETFNLLGLELGEHQNGTQLRNLIEPFHNQALQAFFDYYVPRLSPTRLI